MYDTKSKIKFYSLGSEKIDFSKINSKDFLDSSKPVVVSEGFNKALKNVIDKDIEFLSNKVKKIIKEIKKILVINNINNEELKDDIKVIDDIVNEVESIISNTIIEKENFKLGLFSTNKKEKKQKHKSMEDCINVLSKYQAELISIKNEYNKLNQRKEVLKDSVYDETSDDEPSLEDPLERTINFYLNKQKEN